MSGTEVAFIGLGSKGLYATRGGVLEEVLSVGDLLDGQVILDLDLASDARDGDAIAFWAQLNDGTTGIYLAAPQVKIPSLAPAALAVLVALVGGLGIGGVALARRCVRA
jgi:hypothetical protein